MEKFKMKLIYVLLACAFGVVGWAHADDITQEVRGTVTRVFENPTVNDGGNPEVPFLAVLRCGGPS
jgi:hypothetical protein